MATTKKTNREYLLTMLTALEGKRAAAKGLKVLIQKGLINDKQIMQLLHMFLGLIYESHTEVDLNSLMNLIKK